jgi:hypothetical protein
MTGTTTGIILIPIVVVFSLALWLAMVYWAAAHPENRPRKGAPPLQSGAAYYRAPAVQDPPRASPAPALATPDAEKPDAEEPPESTGSRGLRTRRRPRGSVRDPAGSETCPLYRETGRQKELMR